MLFPRDFMTYKVCIKVSCLATEWWQEVAKTNNDFKPTHALPTIGDDLIYFWN